MSFRWTAERLPVRRRMVPGRQVQRCLVPSRQVQRCLVPSRQVITLVWLWTVVSACTASGPELVSRAAPEPVRPRLDHLRHLGMDLTVAGGSVYPPARNGAQVRAVSVYAEAPDYAHTPSPARDGFEGVACVDDAARAAVVYLRDFESTADLRSRDEALGLLAFVAAMEQGDGEYFNFVGEDGTPNRVVPSSRKAFSYWAGRALWALGEAVRVLGGRDPQAVAALRPTLERTVARLAREVEAGRLVGGSATATAEALLGVLALHTAEPSDELARLAASTAELLVSLSRGSLHEPPWGAFLDDSEGPWHAWGARSTQALATAAVVLSRPDLAVAARREADHLWLRFLLAGDWPAEVSQNGDVRSFPQIAYGLSPIVEGYLALARATGERRYAGLAGLAAGWFLGANRAGLALYDEETGRTFDGLRSASPADANRNSGAESTIEALLALGAVASHPEAARLVRYRPAQTEVHTLGDAPARREFVGPHGRRVALSRRGSGFELTETEKEFIQLTYWPAANPIEVRPARLLAARWNVEHPNVRVRVQPIPAGRSSEEVLLAAVVGRATPDICSNVSSALLARLARARGVVRLDRLAPTAARLVERASEPMLAPLRLLDGGLYALPWKTNPMMLMYNVDLLEAAGTAPPRTHSELLEVLRRLARDTDGDGRLDRWGLWARLKPIWFERFYDFYPLYLAGSGGRTLVSQGRVTFDNEAAVAALEVLRRAFAASYLPRSNFDGRDPFMDGVVAMKIVGPWFVHELEELKVPGLRYDVAPVPVPDGADPQDAYAFADLKNIAVFSTTRHPEAAARFVAYITSPEADRLLIEDAAQLPYRRGLTTDARFAAALARWPTLPAYARLVERGLDLDVDPDVVEILDILSEAYEAAAVYDTVSARQAVHDAAEEARELLRAR